MSPSEEVELWVYDLSNGMARQMSAQLTGRQIDGIWHSSVVAYGVEAFFGQGISMTKPGRSHHGQPLKKLSMGSTQIDGDTYFEYLDQLRATYTADKYHLLDFNCNHFTNDVVGFLTGKSIPREIKDLPSDFLSTPFGAALRPSIDSMFGSMHRPALSPNMPSAAIASSMESSTAGGDVLQSAARQATQYDVGGSSRTISSHMIVCTNQASFESILRDNKAVVVMFTSENCPPCRVIKPVFESLASNAKHGMYILVDTISGAALASSQAIHATPTFRFYLNGQLSHETKGADARELRSQVDMLLYQAYPPHPHSKLDLPRLRALVHQSVSYTSKPNYDALLNKLCSSTPASAQTLPTFRNRVVPFLASAAQAEACPPDLLEVWLSAQSDLLNSTPAAEWFPALDLLRIAVVDARFAGSLALVPFCEESSRHLASLLPRATALVALRTFTNARAANILNASQQGIDLPLLVNGLLAPEPDVRATAAGLAFMAAKQWRTVDVDEDRVFEAASALIEALGREEDGQVAHRLGAAIGLLLLDSLHHQSLATLCATLKAPQILQDKIGVVKTNEARQIMQETGRLLSRSLQ